MLTKTGRKRGFDFKEPAAANRVLQAATNFYSRREQFIPCLRGYHMIATRNKKEKTTTSKHEKRKKQKQQKKTNKQSKGKTLLTGEQIQNEGNLNEVVLFWVSWKQIELAFRRCVKVTSDSDLQRIRN